MISKVLLLLEFNNPESKIMFMANGKCQLASCDQANPLLSL